MSDLYDKDTYSWAFAQADALRRRSANEIDWENVAEEIESVGRSQESELYARLKVLLLHLLKWTYQPDMRGRSWTATIRVQRLEISKHMRRNPGLKSGLEETFANAYEAARLAASIETDMSEDTFPETSSFTFEQAMDDDFWPEPPSAK
ncbi:MAG TPA: DUF29 domain-containing protein [Caulobacterales bacterium]|nr:DUF29 domain-containing protein [Caulobacterales bacterium]